MLTFEEIQQILDDNVVDSIQAREILGCTRQNINSHVAKGNLRVLKKNDNYTLFLKHDVLKLKR